MPIVQGVIKKEKKILHFSNSVSLSVSYLLKGKSIPLGEIFLLSVPEEKAFLTTLSNYCSLSPQIPTQPLETSAFWSPETSSGPLPSLLPNWLAPEEEPWYLQIFTETSTSGTNLGTEVILASNPLPLLPSTLLLQHRSTDVIWWHFRPPSNIQSSPFQIYLPSQPCTKSSLCRYHLTNVLAFVPLLLQISQLRASFSASLSHGILCFPPGSAQSAPESAIVRTMLSWCHWV